MHHHFGRLQKEQDGEDEVYIVNGKVPTGMHPLDWAKKVESLGRAKSCCIPSIGTVRARV